MMRLEELLPDVLRRWWVVLIAAVVAASIGYALTSDHTGEYSVSVRIAANAEPADYWLDLYAKNRLATYEPMINNYNFVQGALAAADLDVDPSHAQQVLQVSHITNQNILTITVVDTQPERAANIANAVQAAFIELNEEQNADLVARVERDPDTFTPRVVMTMLETAGPPDDPVAGDRRTTSIAAGLLGAIAGGLVVVLLIYRDDALRSLEDIDRHVARPVLAVIRDDAVVAER